MTHKCMALSIIKPIWFHMHTDTSLRSSFDKIQLVTSKYVHMRSLCEILFTSILPHLSFVFSPRCVFVSQVNLLYFLLKFKLFYIKFIELVFVSNFHIISVNGYQQNNFSNRGVA